MRNMILCAVLFLAACAPQTSNTTPIVSTLQPYQTLTPSATASQPDGLVVSFETPLPSPTPFVYVVASGDTLSQIAEKFNVSLDVLLAANPNVDPNSMTLGQKLNIPSNPANLTGESTPTPVPFPVQQIVCRPTSERGMWCFVLVRNDTNDFMENITAQVSLNANGQTISSQTALLPLNILPPNTSLPLVVFFAPDIPSDAKPQAQILTGIRLSPGDERYLPATLQNTLVQVDGPGFSAQVSGQVRLPANAGAAKLVWVAAVAYDESGNVIGVRRWESTAGLPAGGGLPFAFMVSSVAGKIARVEFAVEARP
ncbi:MAG: LysM peptidoglycan-binding domain-containing protein [Chloroflexi bacterium]|nr:LysM peptidoglycan-binding domain-containing protein [Chloroflexota bacterium]MBI3339034.1 LysM peptidoglycan-binding domain-containing protein [Chloroflexota bacterium]